MKINRCKIIEADCALELEIEVDAFVRELNDIQIKSVSYSSGSDYHNVLIIYQEEC